MAYGPVQEGFKMFAEVKEEMPFAKHPAVIRLSGAALLQGLEDGFVEKMK